MLSEIAGESETVSPIARPQVRGFLESKSLSGWWEDRTRRTATVQRWKKESRWKRAFG